MKTLHSLALVPAVCSMVAATAGYAAGREASYVNRNDGSLAIGNDFLELQFTSADGRCAATGLVNKLAGRQIAIQTDGFSLGIEGRNPLVAADFKLKSALDEPISQGRRLVLRFESANPGVELDVIYELGDGDHFLRRKLEASVKEPLALRQVDVWLAGLDAECSHQGFGEPVFLDDTFWGLEFPGGHNHFTEGLVKLTQFPGRTVADRFVSKTAVLGVAEPGRVARRFLRYVETFRITPQKTSLFVNYNTWWTLMPPTEENCLALIDQFKQKLFDPFGESFDTFTIDDGWDNKNSLWAIRADRFPRGFQPLIEPLGAMNANLGLWLSPSSGYSHAPWGGTHGYEQNSNPWYLCQSGPNYRRDIVKVVTGLAEENEMAFFKFDGFCPSCEAQGHGHLPGPYAQEANIDAYIELLTAVRRVRPDVYLDPTCGMWLSPWWLAYADSLWGLVSGDYPSIVVPAPVIRDSATTTRDAVFRQRCREHPGYPPAAIEHLGVIVITPEKWEDNAMMVLGRGCRLLTLYINPAHFRNGDRDWAFLASILKWVRHNAETLQQTELILGDPMNREPYGYAHFDGPRGILALRNPFIEPQAVTIALDESVGWSRPEGDAPLAARIVYPRQEVLRPLLHYGDSLELVLQAYETVILHIEPVDEEQPLLVGARYCEIDRPTGRVKIVVYGRPGEKLDVSLAGSPRPEKVSFDGRPVGVSVTDGRTELPLEFAGQQQACAVADAKLTAEASETAWQIRGACVADVPPGTQATMYLLCDPQGSSSGTLECTAQVDGSPVEVRTVRSPDRQRQTHGRHPWAWFAFDVPADRHEVAVAIGPSDDGWGFFRGGVGWWLWAEHPLTEGALTMEFTDPLPPVREEPLPLSLGMERQRQIVTIRPATLFRAGNRWPKLDRAVVWLDEVAPDEVAQDWGKVVRNRSVWDKEMIVAGKKFERGLGTHANSRIVYELSGGKFQKFLARVGRDEHANDGRLEFEVWVDGKRAFESGPMTKESPAKPVEVDLQGAGVLELRTLDGGDEIHGDHGNWAEAQLIR